MVLNVTGAQRAMGLGSTNVVDGRWSWKVALSRIRRTRGPHVGVMLLKRLPFSETGLLTHLEAHN